MKKHDENINWLTLVFVAIATGIFGMAVANQKVSFEVSRGFDCHEQEGTAPCPDTYTYSDLDKNDAVKILGQAIKYNGLVFKEIN